MRKTRKLRKRKMALELDATKLDERQFAHAYVVPIIALRRRCTLSEGRESANVQPPIPTPPGALTRGPEAYYGGYRRHGEHRTVSKLSHNLRGDILLTEYLTDYRDYLLPTDITTPGGLIEWQRKALEAIAFTPGAADRPYFIVAYNLTVLSEQQLEVERRRACRRGAQEHFSWAKNYRTKERQYIKDSEATSGAPFKPSDCLKWAASERDERIFEVRRALALRAEARKRLVWLPEDDVKEVK